MHDLQGLARRVGGCMGVRQCLAELTRDEGAQPRWRGRLLLLGAPLEPRRQALAIDVLHRQEVAAVDLSEIENRDDVAMHEPSADARLVEEHLNEAPLL